MRDMTSEQIWKTLSSLLYPTDGPKSHESHAQLKEATPELTKRKPSQLSLIGLTPSDRPDPGMDQPIPETHDPASDVEEDPLDEDVKNFIKMASSAVRLRDSAKLDFIFQNVYDDLCKRAFASLWGMTITGATRDRIASSLNTYYLQLDKQTIGGFPDPPSQPLHRRLNQANEHSLRGRCCYLRLQQLGG